MSLITEIRAKIAEGVNYSRHAVQRGVDRDIPPEDILDAIRTGEVIEDYPRDKYGPSCLILGTTRTGRPLHVQCSYPTRPVLKIITVYEPDPELWIGLKLRRSDEDAEPG